MNVSPLRSHTDTLHLINQSLNTSIPAFALFPTILCSKMLIHHTSQICILPSKLLQSSHHLQKGLSSPLYTSVPHMHCQTLLYINFNYPLSAAPLNKTLKPLFTCFLSSAKNTTSPAKSNAATIRPLYSIYIRSFGIYCIHSHSCLVCNG